MAKSRSGRRDRGIDFRPKLLRSASDQAGRRRKVICVLGTRPEAIKLAPVLRALANHPAVEVKTVVSGQHRELVDPVLRMFGIRADHNLRTMRRQQTPSQVLARVLAKLDPILRREAPDMILVQGDTSTALAGALAGSHQKIPVAHVEAGLRSGNLDSPFPEEMNRRMISQVATWHYAATSGNRGNLLQEGIPASKIFVTGNPGIDALQFVMKRNQVSARIKEIVRKAGGRRMIALTTHRRESFGQSMWRHLRELRRFVEKHEDVCVVFAVHPNPNVETAARSELKDCARVHLVDPLDYSDFIELLRSAWLIVSDSGGIQEEAPTLGKPLLVLRSNTERPEAIDCGIASLAGDAPGKLTQLLEGAYSSAEARQQTGKVKNPFGDGKAGARIAGLVASQVCGTERRPVKTA